VFADQPLDQPRDGLLVSIAGSPMAETHQRRPGFTIGTTPEDSGYWSTSTIKGQLSHPEAIVDLIIDEGHVFGLPDAR